MLKIRPQSRQALEGLSMVALSRGDYSGAVQHCSALVKIARNIPKGARPTMPAGVFLVGEDDERMHMFVADCYIIQIWRIEFVS